MLIKLFYCQMLNFQKNMTLILNTQPSCLKFCHLNRHLNFKTVYLYTKSYFHALVFDSYYFHWIFYFHFHFFFTDVFFLMNLFTIIFFLNRSSLTFHKIIVGEDMMHISEFSVFNSIQFNSSVFQPTMFKEFTTMMCSYNRLKTW